jgi:predicted metal-binding membrane protein
MRAKLITLPAFSLTSVPLNDGVAAGLSDIALGDLKIRSVVGAIVLLTALGWYALLTSAPMALMYVCGAGGTGSLVPAWDLARAGALVAMWGAMSCVMMLPCATAHIVDVSWTLRERNGVFKAALSFSAGYLGVSMIAGVGGALAQWGLESAGAMTDGSIITDRVLRGGLVAVAALLVASAILPRPAQVHGRCIALDDAAPLVLGLRHGWSRFGSCVAMICVQLAGGAMNVAWMAVLAAWMLAGSFLARGRLPSALAGVALFGIAGLVLSGF